MQAVYSCITEAHDRHLLLLAALICMVGVYASSSIARHAARAEGRDRRIWSLIAILAAGCTAWATHMIGLLAFNPGMLSGFEPLRTGLSLALAVLGIGLALATSIGTRNRVRRFFSGVLLCASITILHYLGQSSYVMTARVSWDVQLVTVSVIAAIPLFGAAMVMSGERTKFYRLAAAPLLVTAIAVLHFGGMTALKVEFDPQLALPDSAVSPDVIAPVVASVCAALVLLAFIGLRFALAAQAQARRDRIRLKQLADLAVEGLAICDGQTIDAANDSLVALSGYTKEKLAGRTLSSLLSGLQIEDIPEQEEQETELRAADSRRIPVRVLRKTVRIGNREQVVVAVRDQSERLRTEKKMERLAYTDPLTGLANRLRFGQILAAACEDAVSSNGEFALLLLDLDRFKSVNDTFGHLVGDELLKRVAKRVSACNKDKSALGRLGGDEFAIIVGNSVMADEVAGTILELLSRPFLINGLIIDIGASIGIATSLLEGSNPATLSKQADLALYAAKHQGGSVFKHFEPVMSERAEARRGLELDLRRALARNEFEVYYQPQVDPKSGQFQGAEALVRWHHPTRGMVSPADFIPLAEEIGLIGSLGEWVLRTACKEAMSWPSGITVAVNLSAYQLHDSALAQTVSRVLRDTGLPPQRLELEITEGALLQENTTTSATLRAIRAMGIGLSMDDFGTGYSSLNYLRRFPFTKIKIDQSFIRQIPADGDSVAIVQAITSLAARLGMTVTVEGVETPEQRAFTVSEGCDQIQGYLISRPVDNTTIRALFVAPKKAVA